jgi:hypothetical protein
LHHGAIVSNDNEAAAAAATDDDASDYVFQAHEVIVGSFNPTEAAMKQANTSAFLFGDEVATQYAETVIKRAENARCMQQQ